MKRYKKYMRPYLSAFIIGPLLMLTEVFGEIMLPKLMSMIINHGVADRNLPYILSMGAVMVLTTFVMAAGGIGGAYFSAKASICFTSDLRDDLFAKVQEFSFKNIDSYSTGSLVTRLTNDIQQIQNVVMMGLRLMLRAPGMFVGALIMAFIMNARLAVVILVVIPLLTLTIALILRTAFPRFTVMQKKLDRLNSGIQEALTNVRVIKSFVREDFEYNKFKEMNQDLKESSLSAMKIVIATMPVMMLAMNITTLAVVWYGGNIIIAGDMPVGDLTAFTTYIVQILMSLMMLSMVFLQSSRAMASVKRVSEVMDTRIDLTDEQASRKDLVVAEGRVEFRHVDFSYSDNEKELVLEDVSFTVEPGQTLGIIGSTGSGKTTLVQMIPRLYDATREEIRAMAQSAQADGFVTSFTHGYDTDMGQGGVNVSGGQKQRLCIARALLKRPRILILDDSTSAVDTATEAKIRECFRTTLKDTTKIIIAQRIGSVEESDLILVLDDGRIIGQGSHKDLLEHCEAYQEIYYSQRDREKTQEVSAS